MKKITFDAIDQQQLVDTRLQHAYQAGSIKQALNIPLAKFANVATQLLDKHVPLVFILEFDDPKSIDLLEEQATALGFPSPISYLFVEDIPTDKLVTTHTITAADFLATDQDYILLDVRDQATVTKAAPEKNLLTVSLENLASEISNLDADKEIYTLCGSGNSATVAASFLNKHGRKATVIEGGVKAIQKEATDNQ